jgi:hypothetical protein
VQPDHGYAGTAAISRPNGANHPDEGADMAIYSIDPVVRRARALQLTEAAKRARGEGGEQ